MIYKAKNTAKNTERTIIYPSSGAVGVAVSLRIIRRKKTLGLLRTDCTVTISGLRLQEANFGRSWGTNPIVTR